MTDGARHQEQPRRPSDDGYRYPDTADQVIELLSDPEHQAWVQNVQSAYARGDLYPHAFQTVDEYDAYVAESPK